jgi:hypothetical protein
MLYLRLGSWSREWGRIYKRSTGLKRLKCEQWGGGGKGKISFSEFKVGKGAVGGRKRH